MRVVCQSVSQAKKPKTKPIKDRRRTFVKFKHIWYELFDRLTLVQRTDDRKLGRFQVFLIRQFLCWTLGLTPLLYPKLASYIFIDPSAKLFGWKPDVRHYSVRIHSSNTIHPRSKNSRYLEIPDSILSTPGPVARFSLSVRPSVQPALLSFLPSVVLCCIALVVMPRTNDRPIGRLDSLMIRNRTLCTPVNTAIRREKKGFSVARSAEVHKILRQKAIEFPYRELLISWPLHGV